MSSASSSSSSSSSALETASRMRRQRRNAISRATESEQDWDVSSTPEPLPWHDDELVCPLASSVQTSARLSINLVDDDDDLQAVLARFTFPKSSRKHRRSGQIVDHSVTTSASTLSSDRRCSGGPVRRAWCAHCECGRSSA